MENTILDYILLGIILLVCVYSFIRLHNSKKKKDYLLFGGCFITFVIVYLVCISNVTISGDKIAIQKARQEINQSKDEIIKITSDLIKIAHIISDGSGRIGGMPKGHLDEIKNIQDSLRNYLDPNLNQQIDSMILKLNMK